MGDHLGGDPLGRRIRLVPPLTLQPPSYFKYTGGQSVSTKVSFGSDYMVAYSLGQQNPAILNCQRQMNSLMGGGGGFTPWRTPNGSPFLRLNEHGILDYDTQTALRNFQLMWGLPPTGDLCLLTRSLINPALRFRGHLQLKYPSWVFRNRGVTGPAPNTPNPPGKPAPAPPKVTPAPTPSGKSGSGEDEDKPWVPQLKLNYGWGVTKPLWVGRTLSGVQAPGDAWKAEIDQKLEFDLEVPTSLMLGDGHLTLSLGGEYDVPVDKAHKGKPTAQGTFEVSADDLYKFGGKRASLSPFVDFGVGNQTGQWSGFVKAGVELKLQLWKNGALKADVNGGVQKNFAGLDKDKDPKVVVPFEGNARFEVSF